MALARPWEGREKEAHGEGIIQVPQCIHKGWVPAARQEEMMPSHLAPKPQSCSSWWGPHAAKGWASAVTVKCQAICGVRAPLLDIQSLTESF